MNYTKGEWKVEDKTQVVSGNRLVANTGGFTNNYSDTLTENKINAQLISAAPELYEALKNLVDRGLIRDLDGDHFYEVMDALRKAEGRE